MKRASAAKGKEGKKQLGVLIDVEQWKAFRKLAIDRGQTATSMISQAMTEFLERHGTENVAHEHQKTAFKRVLRKRGR